MTPAFFLSFTILLVFIKNTLPLRCYTDIAATKSLSVECGMSTGCLKIYKKAAQFDSGGEFIPPIKRGPDIQLFRGCFLVATTDTCYDSSSTGLSYCWCSHSDLCNPSTRNLSQVAVVVAGAIFSLVRTLWLLGNCGRQHQFCEYFLVMSGVWWASVSRNNTGFVLGVIILVGHCEYLYLSVISVEFISKEYFA